VGSKTICFYCYYRNTSCGKNGSVFSPCIWVITRQ
jgi:hypothetical protein